jgi:hypothetical protein
MKTEPQDAAQRRDDYLAKAADADEIAAAMRDSQARKSWEQIAVSWRALAEQIGRTSRY